MRQDGVAEKEGGVIDTTPANAKRLLKVKTSGKIPGMRKARGCVRGCVGVEVLSRLDDW
jgi:hypothetical protein